MTGITFTNDLELLDDYAFVAWLLQAHGRDTNRHGLSQVITRNLPALYDEYQRERNDQETTS